MTPGNPTGPAAEGSRTLDTIRVERPQPGLVILTLDRPDVLNAVNATMIRELGAMLEEIRRSCDDRVVVLTGAGRAFSSGMDQAETGYEEQTRDGNLPGLLGAQQDVADLVLMLRRLPQPVIAAVNGAAVGAGMAFALGADIRLAADRATFAVGAISIGLSGADMGMTWHLPRAVGTSRAAEWLLTGRRIDAAEASTAGLVSRTVEADSLLTDAKEIASSILRHQSFAVRLTKEALWDSISTAGLATAIGMENRTQVLAAGHLLNTLAASAAGPTKETRL